MTRKTVKYCTSRTCGFTTSDPEAIDCFRCGSPLSTNPEEKQ